ncbi:glycosyltransferase family 4 protein [Candidatus Microgenomates bacterium]|nr:glycosyltransferase family 4 protein [Candidatus Daviesbacteria bacterium]MBI2622074.1 glycosyltransferase family 4 protein [Candidatus Microgenomates bacterium]
MRIGIDARLWNERGVGRYIRNLIKHLQVIDKSNEYVLFVRSGDIDSIKYYVSSIKHKLVKTDIRWHTIEEQLKLPSILNKEKLDLVHFPYFSVPIFYHKPFVVTIHDLILHHFPTGEASTLPLPLYKLKLLGYEFVISQAVKKAKKIITVSNATKKEIIDHLGISSGKIAVTYEGIDDALNSKLQLKIQNYFLYVGNAYPHKNLERLLETVAMMKDKGLMINVVMVGKEDYFYRRLKEKVKKMNLVNNVIFYGEATDEELLALYKNAKALILPSLMEGFGLPALEAMASGCLVIASDIPAIREICGEAAIYFNPYNINDIANKMEAVHPSDKLAKGLRRAKEFSWRKMAEQTLEVYKKI